ncbi:VPLPA-CTERM sorting domain-containing protein [Pacificoceanicola onchidii]|uniref:VPLPA-CTERM sorting domain-containing protein n=1 Tax=Pacificoceanicola onchidii TaxID=2562685 RepID=UPI001F0FEE49|nr:VPLPA-CTERM sorting domain-containing protein [Pacificoceanicola onchidii]
MRRTALSLAALAFSATTATAVPVSYSVNFTYPGAQYYCVGCGGAYGPPTTAGGTLSGSFTLDGSLTGTDIFTDFNFTSGIPENVEPFVGMPEQVVSYTFGDPYVTISDLGGGSFSIRNHYGHSGFLDSEGWVSILYMTFADMGDIGTSELEVDFNELFRLRGYTGFGYYGHTFREDSRGQNVGPSVDSAASATLISAVPLPAGGLLLLTGLGAIGLMRRKKV